MVPAMTHHTTSTSTHRRRLFAPALLTMAALTITACGQDQPDAKRVASLASTATTTPATPGSAPLELEDAFVQYAECMRAHGVDMPDPQVQSDGGQVIVSAGGPGGGGSDIDPEVMRAADEACTPIMKRAISDAPRDPVREAEELARLEEYVACMREHGVEMADPTVDANGGISVSIDARGAAPNGTIPQSSVAGPSGSTPEPFTPAFSDPVFAEADQECSKLNLPPGAVQPSSPTTTATPGSNR